MTKPETVAFTYGKRRKTVYGWKQFCDNISDLLEDDPKLGTAKLFDKALDIVKDDLPPVTIVLDCGDGETFTAEWERFLACLERPEIASIGDFNKRVQAARELYDSRKDLAPQGQ